MKIEFDEKVDAAFVYFKDISAGEVKRTISLDDNLNIDLDKDGKILGIEILNASESIPVSSLSELKEKCIS